MKMTMEQIDQRFRWILLIITLFLGAIRWFLEEENIWIHGSFIICMAGIVGYFTNFLAIRMLFQPKRGTVLGWEGLVPKNKPDIARSLGESIQTQLLAPEIILEYIQQHQLIEKSTENLVLWIDQMLQNETIRGNITDQIISILKTRGPEYVETLFNHSESAIQSLARDPETIKKYWMMIRKEIQTYTDSLENRNKIAEFIRKVVQEKIPQIAEVVDSAMDRYLTEHQGIGTIGIGLKKLISFDSSAIHSLLERFIADPETSQRLVGVLDILVAEISEKINSPETQHLLVTKIEQWVDLSADFARRNILPQSIEQLQIWLDDPKSWQQIDYSFLKLMEQVKSFVLQFANSSDGKTLLKNWIGKAVHKINVTDLVEEQVMKLDTDELEKMILNNTGGNLVVIQFIGGVLGLIAGLVQVHIGFAFPLIILIVIVWIAHEHNRRYYERIGAKQ
ncbi:MAG: DUF445 family protein [SAR324 cluster bacterium]|nr:DUF445 family protein [SAR324 cluster bacterium]